MEKKIFGVLAFTYLGSDSISPVILMGGGKSKVTRGFGVEGFCVNTLPCENYLRGAKLKFGTLRLLLRAGMGVKTVRGGRGLS